MKTTQAYKLILADDHILLRDALANLINTFDEFAVVATAGNGEEVVQAVENGSRPDIILMDLNMPKLDGYETARWLQQRHPEIKIVILTMQCNLQLLGNFFYKTKFFLYATKIFFYILLAKCSR